MTEPPDQNELSSWAERGDPVHAWYSYRMVKDVLTRKRLGGLSCSIYPQGSYANKTNIVGDSDVDMVIALTSAFYPYKGELSEAELRAYSKYYERADTTWHQFRERVIDALRPEFFLDDGSKCVKVRSGLIRLPADVLIALDYRHYKAFPSFEGQRSVDGVQFYAHGTTKVVNYPKRHIGACAKKEDRTFGEYRRIVRVAKNARNRLAADNASPVDADTAPSYFLESLLWNVPDNRYAGGLEQACHRVTAWLYENKAELSGMYFPNGMVKIFGDTPDAAWDESKARTIIDGLYRQLNR